MNNNNQDKLKEIKILKLFIKECNYSYYILGKEKVSDNIYDVLKKKLELLEYNLNQHQLKINSNIGLIINSSKKKHFKKIRSIKSFFEVKNIFKNFINKYSKNSKYEFIIQSKIDGISLNLLYLNGKLQFITTRGDGIYGEDCSFMIPYIKNLSLYIKDLNFCFINGELCLNKDFFNKYCFKKFKHARNVIIALLKKKEYDIFFFNKLEFIAFDIQTKDNNVCFKSYYDKILFLKKYFRIPITKKKIIFSDNFISLHNNLIQTIFHNSDFICDGIVYKLNDLVLSNNNFKNKRYYNYIAAFKKNIIKVSKVQNIYFNISRFGKLVPILSIEEIKLTDRIIKKISLYSLLNLQSFNININDIVCININGMIPKLIKNLNVTTNREKKHMLTCSFCYKKIVLIKRNGYCYNYNCYKKNFLKIMFFCKVMGIKLNQSKLKKIFSIYKISFVKILMLNLTMLKKIFASSNDIYLNQINESIINAKNKVLNWSIVKIIDLLSFYNNFNIKIQKIISNRLKNLKYSYINFLNIIFKTIQNNIYHKFFNKEYFLKYILYKEFFDYIFFYRNNKI